MTPLLPSLDRRLGTPLHRQIYEHFRDAILAGRLGAGQRLPSSRELAEELAVARETAVLAYDLLRSEGYIDGLARGTTRVAASLPERSIRAAARAEPIAAAESRRKAAPASRRARLIAAASARFPPVSGRPARAFRTSVPALDVFPMALWGRLAARRWRTSTPSSLAYSDPRGLPELRAAIASYLSASRGVRCGSGQVIVTAGSQQGVDLAARALLDPGDAVWMEDPGYFGAAGAFVAAGARLVPVPVDGEGIDVAAGIARCPDARLAFVTPARQLPLGVTLSLPRRLALLAWAAARKSFILEDDYDSEFRYKGRPLSSLQGLDAHGRVIFAGTFSKVLLPGLRLGYLVVPEALVDTFTAVRRMMDFAPPALIQGVAADFIAGGHFERHVRRMRNIYRERRALLVRLLRRQVGQWCDIDAPDAGMNLIAWLRPLTGGRGAGRWNDKRLCAVLAERGVDALPMSGWAVRRRLRPGLMLGFSGIREPDLREGVLRLRTVLREAAVSKLPRAHV